MAPPPTISPVTGEPCPPYMIHANSAHFRDAHGRTLLLRGINVTASAKTPQGQPQQKLEGFWEQAESGDMTFVDRVFDLGAGGHDTDVHLRRLKAWGFNTLRYIFTWEAIEHRGPGQYDREFIDYTVRMLRKIKSFGFRVYMDPHQDLFSRFSGGCGAPYWSLLACGMNPRNFSVTNAAMLQCEWPTAENPDPENFPDMIWASNYTRLAAMTLFTMFFAGRDFAPKCVIDGINIQDWLHDKFFGAVTVLAEAIRDAGGLNDICVIGWDSMNEPNEGLVGTPDLRKHRAEGAAILRIGPTPNALEAMRLGEGETLQVENWRFGPLGPKRDGSVTIDPQGRKAWLDPNVEDADGRHPKYGWRRSPDWKLGTCIWAQHGVWDVKTGQCLKPAYFATVPGSDRKVSFISDYWRCHYVEYAKMIRRAHAEAILFILPPVFQVPPAMNELESLLKGRACHSTHFYDGLTLITKHWNWYNADAVGMLRGKYRSVLQAVRIGEANIRKCLREQLGTLRQDTFDAVGQYPTMFGEIGIPFDLDKALAYQTGDYHNQVRAMDASLNACDGPNVLNYSIWTYCPDNYHRWGDQWNTEDLSIWSADDAQRTSKARKAKPYRTLSQHYQYSGQRLGPIKSLLDQVAPRPKTGSSANLTAEDTAAVSATSSMSDDPAAISTRQRNTSMRTLLSPPSQVSLGAKPKTEDDDDEEDDVVMQETGPETVSYVEINDGARALPAFVRPFPIRTVGVPVDINFDIQSSEFTLTVEVRHDDMAPGSTMPTEIYLPLVHYAAAPKAVARAVREDSTDEDSNGSSSPPSQLADSLGSSTLVGETIVPPKCDRVLIKEASENEMMAPSALDLDVQVSAGEWTIQSQLLKWSYPIPTSAEDGVFTYRLRVVRKSGPIQTWTHQYGEAVPTPWHSFLDCSKCAIQ